MPVMFIACIHLKSQNDHWQKPFFIGQYQTVVWRYEPNPSCAQWFSSNLSNSVTMARIMINIIMRHCWGTIWVYGPADFDFTSYDLLFVSIELNFLMALQRYRSATCRCPVVNYPSRLDDLCIYHWLFVLIISISSFQQRDGYSNVLGQIHL